jgi:hypothetical protein
MNEIEVPLKVTGISEIKSQLKEVKNALAAATDPKEMERLAQAAGELKDQLADVNEKVAVFASGSKFEQTSNAFGLMQSQLMSLDFEGAAESAKLFTGTLKNLNPAEFAAAFKGFGSVLMSLGSAIGVVTKQFIAFGISLLANPIFLLVAVIAAIVAAILIFLNKMGILKKVIDVLMKPINDLIAGFKELTDWLGLTSYAAEENAAKMIEANDKIMESSKERQETIVGGFDYEIKMAKIYGKETLDLELAKSKAIGGEAQTRLSSAQKALAAQQKLGDDANAETIKKLKTQIKEENNLIKDQRRERNLLVAQDVVDKREQAAKELEEDKKNAEARRKAAIDAAKKRAEDERKFAENRLAAARLIKDLEISLIASDADREIVATQEKYARLIQDVQKNENYTKDEKIRIQKLYQQELEAELSKQEQVQIDAEKEKNQKSLDEYNKGLMDKYALEEKQALQLQELQAKTADQLTQLAKDKRAIQFDAEVAAAGENQILIEALTAQYQADLNAIDKAASDERIKTKEEEEKRKREEALKTANEEIERADITIKSIQTLGDIAFAAKMAKVKKGSKAEEELAKKQFKFNKAMQLGGAIIDGAKAVTASLASAPLALGPVPNPAGIASLAAAVATSAVNIGKIASTQFNSTGGGGAAGGGVPAASSSSTTGSAAPAFNLFGQGNDLNNVGAPQTQTNEITVNAVVSETEITSTQNKITKINENATL